MGQLFVVRILLLGDGTIDQSFQSLISFGFSCSYWLKAIGWIFFIIIALKNSHRFEYTDNPTVQEQAEWLLSQRLESTLNCTNEAVELLNGENSTSSFLHVPEVGGSSVISILSYYPEANYTESEGYVPYLIEYVQQLRYNYTWDCLIAHPEVRHS